MEGGMPEVFLTYLQLVRSSFQFGNVMIKFLDMALGLLRARFFDFSPGTLGLLSL
jgi:hypothetical protein